MASVTVTYMKEGTKPPLYLAGSFSGWVPEEMEHEVPEGQTEIRFSKTISAEQGKEFQYKFRIGQGDWWVLDETAPVVTDDIGNRNNLLILPMSTTSKMSDQHIETSQEEKSPVAHPAEAPHEADEKSQLSNLASQDQAGTEPSEKAIGVDAKPEVAEKEQENDVAVPATGMNEVIPTLVIEKTDDSPSFGEDFGPDATFAQKGAHSMRSADAEPDLVVIHDKTATSTEAETIAEVSGSAALVDERAKTPDVSEEEAGKIGLRRMSSTPIPEVASTAAEVADSAAVLDEDADTPELSDEEAGRVGLRRLSMTPISVVAATAAEVADSAASLDEQGESPHHIDIPVKKCHSWEIDDDGKEYPITPEDEKAPLLPHEMFIPSEGVSPPKSPEVAAAQGINSANITQWARLVEPGSRNSPRRQDSMLTPEPERQYQLQPDIEEFPSSLEGIMATLDQIQRNRPEDEVRLRSPSDPSSPAQHFSRSDDRLTPGTSPRSEQSRSPMLDPRAISLSSIAEENDSVAVEHNDILSDGQADVDDGNLTAVEYGQISKIMENPEAPEQGLETLKSEGQQLSAASEQVLKMSQSELAAKSEKADLKEHTSPETVEQEFLPLGLPLGSIDQELGTAPAETLDKVIDEGNQDVEIKQLDGNTNMQSEQITPVEPATEVVEVGDDVVSDDSPSTTPPTSSEDGKAYFSSALIAKDVAKEEHEENHTNSGAEGSEGLPIVVHPATPAVANLPAAESEAIVEEANEESGAPEPKSTPVPDEVKTHVHTEDGDTIVTATILNDTSEVKDGTVEDEAEVEAEMLGQESNSKVIPIPDEVKTHLHTQEEDTVITRSVSREPDASKFSDPDATLVAESTITHRKVGKPSTERSRSPDDSLKSAEPLLPGGNEEQPGLLTVICAAVFGWLSFFAGLCDGGRQKKKANKTDEGNGKVKTVIRASSVVIVLVVIVLAGAVWGGWI